MKIPRLKCMKCNHKWTPRKEEVNMCPKCKTKKKEMIVLNGEVKYDG